MTESNPQHNAERFTVVGMTVETYGTDDQRKASLERLKEELELQGFNITFFTEIQSGVARESDRRAGRTVNS